MFILITDIGKKDIIHDYIFLFLLVVFLKRLN